MNSRDPSVDPEAACQKGEAGKWISQRWPLKKGEHPITLGLFSQPSTSCPHLFAILTKVKRLKKYYLCSLLPS